MIQGQLEFFGFGYYLMQENNKSPNPNYFICINYEMTAICIEYFESKKYKLVICPKLCLFLVSELEVTVKTFLTNVCCEKRLPSAVVIL